MDERFRRNGVWIGVGLLAIIFLCVMLCGLGAFATLATRSGPVYGVVPQVQPPVAEDGAAAPQVYGYAPGTWGAGRHVGFSPFSFIFKFLFFGLLLLLLFGLLKRFFWGPRLWGAGHWGHRHWHPPYGARPPRGKDAEDSAPGEWGPWAWHCHGKHWRPPPGWAPEPEQTEETSEPDEGGLEYSGPQE
jgi:hypothetical protein